MKVVAGGDAAAGQIQRLTASEFLPQLSQDAFFCASGMLHPSRKQMLDQGVDQMKTNAELSGGSFFTWMWGCSRAGRLGCAGGNRNGFVLVESTRACFHRLRVPDEHEQG